MDSSLIWVAVGSHLQVLGRTVHGQSGLVGLQACGSHRCVWATA